MKDRIKEWISIQLAKNPGKVVLISIFLLNICICIIAGFIISRFQISGTSDMGFWQALFYTITMVLDAGCILGVVSEIGTTGVALILICLVVVIIGMVTFTGAIIGYMSNYISDFINHANSGARKIKISGHTVVLNWNTRAAEIINDMLYCEGTQKVVVLANRNKEEIEKEIEESISDTISREYKALRDECAAMSFFERARYMRKHSIRRNIVCIVREGDTYSIKQLSDISIEKAKSVIILGNDINNNVCKYNHKTSMENRERGNVQTVKTLVQVADLTGADSSNDDQKIIVEIEDDWTMDLVRKIIHTKQVKGKCSIVPVRVNQILGQLLSQFTIMPELNMVYRELFSNKGASFYAKKHNGNYDYTEHNKRYLENHKHSIPLRCMRSDGVLHYYYSAGKERHIERTSNLSEFKYDDVKLNPDYWISKRTVIILGHNSKCRDIMEGFKSFGTKWNRKDDEGNTINIVKVVVIDDEKHLEKMNYYKQYPFVVDIEKADVYDKEGITSKINDCLNKYSENTSILILSDDTLPNEEIDAGALANLINVQDIIKDRKKLKAKYNAEKVDIIVEILNPKNHDIVTSYSINNVVISNRYISKMLNQIGEKSSLFDLYNDILSYDNPNPEMRTTMEIYAKSVENFFTDIPGKCTAEKLIRAVYDASIANNTDEINNMSVVLGYVKPNIGAKLFTGNQSKINVELMPGDKLILFGNH